MTKKEISELLKVIDYELAHPKQGTQAVMVKHFGKLIEIINHLIQPTAGTWSEVPAEMPASIASEDLSLPIPKKKSKWV